MNDPRLHGEQLSEAIRAATRSVHSTFPLDCLPPWLANAVGSIAERLQVSHDMPAAFVFPALSAAVGRTLRVEAWHGFQQPAVVWAVVVAASGENKSAVVNALRRPVVEYQSLRRAREADDHRDASIKYDLLKAQAETMKSMAAKNKCDMADAEAALKAAQAASPGPEFRLTFDSATPEALAALLVAHGFLAHLEPEGDVFGDIVGRYGKGGTGLIKIYLDAFDGEAIALDRVLRGSISAERTGLVMGVAVQPDFLRTMLAEAKFKGRGLIERCLFAMPSTLVGRRNVSQLEGRPGAEEDYRTRVIALCERHHGSDEPHVIALSPAARDAFIAFRGRLEQRLTRDLASVSSWANKVQGGIALRLAGLLAVAWDSNVTEVSVEVMCRTIRIIEEFFIPHALRTFGDLRGEATDHLFKQVEALLRERELTTPRDLQRARNDLFPTAEAASAALNDWVDVGRMERVERPRQSSSGPPPKPGYRLVRQVRQVRATVATPQNTETNDLSDLSANMSDLSGQTGAQS